MVEDQKSGRSTIKQANRPFAVRPLPILVKIILPSYPPKKPINRGGVTTRKKYVFESSSIVQRV